MFTGKSPPVAQGQMQPRKLNSESSTKSNIKTKSNHDISPNPMSPINKTNTHSSYTAAQDSNKKNSDCDFGTVKNDPITRYTFWLMIFTGLLVVCNLLLWLYTRKIAKAAKISADVLPTIEKAYVYAAINFKKIEPHHTNQGFTGLYDFSAQIEIWNHGKTPAIINKICGLICLEKPILSKIEENQIPYNLILGSGGMRPINTVPIIINEEKRKDILGELTGAYCYGRIEYEDVFGGKYAR